MPHPTILRGRGGKSVSSALLVVALMLLVAWSSPAQEAPTTSVTLVMLEPADQPPVVYHVPAPETASNIRPLTHRQLLGVLHEARWPRALWAKAAAVAGCESGWNPHSVGGSDEKGIFQIHPVHEWRFAETFATDANPFDPVQNAAIALEIWQEDGWQPWTCRRAGV